MQSRSRYRTVALSSASVAFVDAVCPAGMVAIAGSFGFDSGIVFVERDRRRGGNEVDDRPATTSDSRTRRTSTCSRTALRTSSVEIAEKTATPVSHEELREARLAQDPAMEAR